MRSLRPIFSLPSLHPKIPFPAAGHRTSYSLGSHTLDWYFELGDLVFDEIVIREVFEIPEEADIKEAALEVLNRLHVIGTALTDFSGYFIRDYCAK